MYKYFFKKLFKKNNNIYNYNKKNNKEKPNTNNSQSDQILNNSTNTLKDFNNNLSKALEHYNNREYLLAEEKFAAVLKPVLSKSVSQNIYVNVTDVLEQSLNSLEHLGYIYLNHKSGSENAHAKAAALFQYCAKFLKEHPNSSQDIAKNAEFYLDLAYSAEEKFLEDIKSAHLSKENVKEAAKIEANQYKSNLKELRDAVKPKLEKLDKFDANQMQQRVEVVKEIYNTSTSFFTDYSSTDTIKDKFLDKIFANCHRQLGSLPDGCEYTIISLGSLSGGRMTPWSDLEFAVLIKEDNPEHKEYFKNFTKLLNIKLVNLGETPVERLGIESLNNLKLRSVDQSKDWFEDSLTKKGFGNDGPHWYASKWPLGRTEGYKGYKENDDGSVEEVEKRDFDLICTPKEMAEFQSDYPIDDSPEPTWFDCSPKLVQGLRSASFLEGSMALLNQYGKELSITPSQEILQARSLKILKEDLDKFQLKLGEDEEGKLFDVKKDIYRIGDRIVEGLANYYNILPQKGQPGLNIWQTIDQLQKTNKLNEEGAQHLKEAIAISMELRLRTYSHNNEQANNMSTSMQTINWCHQEELQELVEKTFYIQDIKVLHHFYYVMLPLQGVIKTFCNEDSHEQSELILSGSKLYSNNNYYRGMVHARFLEYNDAIKYLNTAVNEDPENIKLLNTLFLLQNKTGKIQEAFITGEKKLKLLKERMDNNDLYTIEIVKAHNEINNILIKQGKSDEVIQSCDSLLTTMIDMYTIDSNHPEIAQIYNNLGHAHICKGNIHQGIISYEKVLDIRGLVEEPPKVSF